MSARLIDPVDDKPAENSNEPASLEQSIEPVQPTQEAAPEPTPAEPTEPAVPDKYQGKSIQDVIKMHQNAEVMNGKQSSEVGEMRKIIDDFIVNQSQSTKQPEQTEEDNDIDFLDDPSAAVARAIANDPTVKAANKLVENAAKSDASLEAQNALLEAQPDAVEIIGDKEFSTWITQSPSRTRLLRSANTSNDVEAMSEILQEWKDTRPAPALSVDVPNRDSQVSAASAGVTSGGSGGNVKMFRRSDLIKLQVDDPERYQVLMPEIMKAYAEKRVI